MIANVIKLVIVVIVATFSTWYFGLVMPNALALVPVCVLTIGVAFIVWTGSGGNSLFKLCTLHLPMLAWPAATLVIMTVTQFAMGPSSGLALLLVSGTGFLAIQFAGSGENSHPDFARAWVSIQVGTLALYALAKALLERDALSATFSAIGALTIAFVIIQTELIPKSTRKQLDLFITLGGLGVIGVGAVAVFQILFLK